jgi:hypothetical protein
MNQLELFAICYGVLIFLSIVSAVRCACRSNREHGDWSNREL